VPTRIKYTGTAVIITYCHIFVPPDNTDSASSLPVFNEHLNKTVKQVV